MSTRYARPCSRRRFLGGVTLAGTAGLLGWQPRRAAAEPPPETSRLRLVKVPAMCLAPQYLAEELLHLEGFSEVEYIPVEQSSDVELLLTNRADISAFGPSNFLPYLDAGKSVVALAGLHGGCYELFAHDPVRAIRDPFFFQAAEGQGAFLRPDR